MHIYFSGIGGVAIGPLALIARDAGYAVSGSDLAQSRFTDIMQRTGIDFAIGQDGTHIAAVHRKQPINWLVVSSALPADHPEIMFAQQAGIKVTKRADILNTILHDKQLRLVAISGTHGKTTTTAMLVWLFKQFKLPVSYSVGSSFSFGPSGTYAPGSQYFVYECDEYDRNMLAFSPYLSLLTTVDYDHPDTYPTQADYDQAFIEFTNQSGQMVAWQTDAARLKISHLINVSLNNNDAEIATIKLAGLHNRQNAWLAVRAFLQLFPDEPIGEIIHAINNFPGTDRRFERLAPNLYSDYAHHPAEIRATLQLAREQNQLVVAVYQPHQNIRQHQVANEYGDCFNQAAHVYWLPTYLSREDPELAILTPRQLIAMLDAPEMAESAEMDQALLAKIKTHLDGDELVVCMGAGTIDEWLRAHLADLSN